ncbi:putative transposase [Escherichia coli LT-68]|nr:putative transposase [Escherichia coli LT-68]
MSRQCTHYGRWPQHGFTSLKKLRPQSVTSRILILPSNSGHAAK